MTFTVKNTGKRAGADIAQVYVGLSVGAGEPPKRLVGWERVELLPGQSKTLTTALEKARLSIFNVERNAW